jgi:hypothetical protein
MPGDPSWILGWFENISLEDFDFTSDPTPQYNCIAWAAGKQNEPWWPTDQIKGYFWPPGLPKEPIGQETIANFISAFETEGYSLCLNGEVEEGFEKVAIYADANQIPTHAARSLRGGGWTSKLGDEEDIKHVSLESIAGNGYGSPVVFLKRPIQ